MSDYKLFAKCKPLEIRAELEQARKKQRSHSRIKNVLKKVVANIILNNTEHAVLMPEIVELMAIDDLEIRRSCAQFVTRYASLNAKDAKLALPFFTRFAEDLDSNLRALAIKTLSSVALQDYVAKALPATKRLLSDPSAVVRTNAAFSVGRLFQHAEEQTTQSGLIDDLNGLLYDEDSTVVSNTLAALSTITESAQGINMAIDKPHLLTLVRSLGVASEWRQVYILDALMLYVPQTSEDALELLENVLASLLHENSAVVLNAVKAIVYLSNYVSSPELVVPLLPQRIGGSLVLLLHKPPEIQFLVLRNVILLLLGKRYLVDLDVELFFWKFDDPIYIKDTKLEIIFLLADESNVNVVFRELEEYATEVDVGMARKAIRAFGNIAVKLELTADLCVEIFLDLFSDGVPYIIQEATAVIKNILRKYPKRYDHVVDSVLRHYQLMEEPDAKVSVLWITGQYAEKIENADKLLNHFLKSFKDDTLEVQYALLTAVIKFYVMYPLKGESLILEVLKYATEESENPDLRDRGFFYWRMITNDDSGPSDFQKRTKEIVINSDPSIVSGNDFVDPGILEELELCIGSLASIYLKPVDQVFRLAKRKHLIASPALQERRKNEAPSRSSRESSSRLDYQKPQMPANRRRSSSNRIMMHGSSSTTSVDTHGTKVSLGKKITRKASLLPGIRNLKS